jgi:adenylate kinase family enzyme
VSQRDDDTEEAVERRLELYERETGADHRLLPRPGLAGDGRRCRRRRDVFERLLKVAEAHLS